MFKNLLQLYSLVICAISVIIIMIALGFSWGSVTDILLPQYKFAGDKIYNNNESYLAYYKDIDKDLINLKTAEVEKRRLAAKEDALLFFKKMH